MAKAATIEELFERIANLNEDRLSIRMFPMSCTEDYNVIGLRIVSDRYDPSVSGDELDEIADTIGADAEDITVYSSTEDFYLASDNHESALVMEAKVPRPVDGETMDKQYESVTE